MARHNDLCGGARQARSPHCRTDTHSPWRACLSCLVWSGCRLCLPWGASEARLTFVWLSGNKAPSFTSSLAVRGATPLLKSGCCALFTVVLCVLLLLFFPQLCSSVLLASLAGAYFCCSMGKIFIFCKKFWFSLLLIHIFKYLAFLSHCSVTLCCLLQSL